MLTRSDTPKAIALVVIPALINITANIAASFTLIEILTLFLIAGTQAVGSMFVVRLRVTGKSTRMDK
jgi:hypothetical protein